MGIKLLWTGITVTFALNSIVPSAAIVGAVIMVIGCVLMWLDR